MRLVASRRDVATFFDVTYDCVSGWMKKGMPVNEDGGYDLDAISVWRAKQPKRRGKETIENNKLVQNVMNLRTNTGLGPGSIAKTVGVSKKKVQNIIDRIDKYRPSLEHFKQNRADLFAIEQMEYLEHITEDKLANSSARDLANMAKQAWEKERIERGQSVDNVAVIVKHIKELKEQEDADSS